MSMLADCSTQETLPEPIIALDTDTEVNVSKTIVSHASRNTASGVTLLGSQKLLEILVDVKPVS